MAKNTPGPVAMASKSRNQPPAERISEGYAAAEGMVVTVFPLTSKKRTDSIPNSWDLQGVC